MGQDGEIYPIDCYDTICILKLQAEAESWHPRQVLHIQQTFVPRETLQLVVQLRQPKQPVALLFVC